jgi:1,4-dihydroxy-6-naphthoate synthase
MKLSIGFSPCPNDTFIFDALVNRKIDTAGIEFVPVLEDVETLNQWAINGRLDVTKISYGVLPNILSEYGMLSSGGAMGFGVGPLLITSETNRKLTAKQFNLLPIAIPGEHTTAHLLLSHVFPELTQKIFMPFHEIENAVLTNKVAAGVIIHENRFTYADRGLVLLEDLGKRWEESLNSPIPLGGIALKRNLPSEVQLKVDELIRKSLRYSELQWPRLSDYVSLHAQEMDESVQKKHIELYVNDFSKDVGVEGKKAVTVLLQVYHRLKGCTMEEGVEVFLH